MSYAGAGPMATTTTSLTTPVSFRRTALSTAIPSKAALGKPFGLVVGYAERAGEGETGVVHQNTSAAIATGPPVRDVQSFMLSPASVALSETTSLSNNGDWPRNVKLRGSAPRSSVA